MSALTVLIKRFASQLKLGLTPNAVLVAASIVALSGVFISTWIAVHQPWLGVSLVKSEKGLRIEAVSDNGPAANILNPGDVILAIAGQKGNSIQLQPQDIIEDADNIPTLKERDIFRDRQSAIYQILLQPIVKLSLNDGRIMRVQPQSYRPLASMPVSFWLLVFYSVTALLVGAAIWSIKQNDPSAKYLLLSAIGVVFLLNSSNIFISRELALEGTFYLRLIFFYHLGNNLFALGLIGLVWNYPRPVARFPIILVLIAFMLLFMLNEALEWTELPGNSVLLQVLAYWASGIIFIAAQWIRSRGRPVDRANIKRLTMVLLIIIFIILATDVVAVFTSNIPTISLTDSFFALFVFYITLTLVIYRYHLFDIDRWWAEIWLWFFTGVAIVLCDMALVTVANMASPYALVASVVAVGWLYFPIRQWAWARLFHRRQNYLLEEWIPLLVGRLMDINHGNDQHLWEKVLDDVFRPLSIKLKQQNVTEVKMAGNGACLLTPCLDPECGVELYYADKGHRLFNRDDISLAQALFNITRQAMAQKKNYTLGMLEERKRIMRDLHDDIGGKLLTLVHGETEGSQAASDALKSLREIIYSLDTESQTTLNTAVARWRIEALDRCEQANVDFKWHWEEQEHDVKLTPRQHLNLTLIMREGVSNMLRHAKTECNVIDLHVAQDVLQVILTNDGGMVNSKQVKPGKGLRNMQARTEELSGKFRYIYEAGVFCVKFSVPLNEAGAVKDG